MIDRLNIGVCRTSPMGIIPENYEDNDFTVEYIKGFIEMFSNEHNITICTPLNTNEEKIFNNQKIHTKYPFIKKIKYEPFIEKKQLDILVVFSKANKEQKYFIEDITYEKYIENIMSNNKDLKVYYVQYNDVNFEFSKNFDLNKSNVTILINSPKHEDLLLNQKYYGGLEIEGISLDLTELIFQQRISAKDNFYNKVGLFNKKDVVDYNKIKTPNAMNEYIYTLNEFNEGEDNEFIKNDFTNKYRILVEKLQSFNFVFVDKNDNPDFYNSNFVIVANNSYPIIIDKNDHDIHIELEELNFFNEEDIDSYYSQKYLKQLRIDIKKHYIKYNLKEKLENIFISDN